MIRYKSRGCSYLFKLLQIRGSVFPLASLIALPSALSAATLRLLVNRGVLDWWSYSEGKEGVIGNNALWSAFSAILGFLVIFRTSQAYARFCEGCTHTTSMRAEWYDACASLVAFTRTSGASEEEIRHFNHLLIRLFSMLTAVALGEIEESNSDSDEDVNAFRFPLLDPEGIDESSVMSVRVSDCKVQLVFQWIQLTILEAMKTGVLNISPPILTRVFAELNCGMLALHQCIKVSSIPFPFPYAQSCDVLLVLHWVLVQLVSLQWTHDAGWTFAFTFIQVFILWCLTGIATEIENPFGSDANDLDGETMQQEMNRDLLLLLDSRTLRLPKLSQSVLLETHLDWQDQILARNVSLLDCWRMTFKPNALQHNHTRHSTLSTASVRAAARPKGQKQLPRPRPHWEIRETMKAAKSDPSANDGDEDGEESDGPPSEVVVAMSHRSHRAREKWKEMVPKNSLTTQSRTGFFGVVRSTNAIRQVHMTTLRRPADHDRETAGTSLACVAPLPLPGEKAPEPRRTLDGGTDETREIMTSELPYTQVLSVSSVDSVREKCSGVGNSSSQAWQGLSPVLPGAATDFGASSLAELEDVMDPPEDTAPGLPLT